MLGARSCRPMQAGRAACELRRVLGPGSRRRRRVRCVVDYACVGKLVERRGRGRRGEPDVELAARVVAQHDLVLVAFADQALIARTRRDGSVAIWHERQVGCDGRRVTRKADVERDRAIGWEISEGRQRTVDPVGQFAGIEQRQLFRIGRTEDCPILVYVAIDVDVVLMTTTGARTRATGASYRERDNGETER